MALEVYDLCQLTPTDVSIDVVGNAIEGGRSIAGPTQAVSFAAGGYVVADYGGVAVLSKSQHLYWNYLASFLNGGANSILVPLWTDYIMPTNAKGEVPGSITSNVTHSDGTKLSDGTGYQQGTGNVATTSDAALNAYQLDTSWPVGFSPSPGMWFSINHPTKGWRAYRIGQIVSHSGNNWTFVVSPPLREAAPLGSTLLFLRPLCTMRLKTGTSMDWHFTAGGMAMVNDISFVEAFPS